MHPFGVVSKAYLTAKNAKKPQSSQNSPPIRANLRQTACYMQAFTCAILDFALSRCTNLCHKELFFKLLSK